VIFLILILFKKEIRLLLSSIGSFKIGSNNFEFRDKKAEAQAFADLSDILIDILSTRDSASRFKTLISYNNAQKLKRFCDKYIAEVNENSWNYELLKNCALILALRQFQNDSIKITEHLLKLLPNDIDCLNMLAIAYSSRKADGDLAESEKILSMVIEREPFSIQYLLNRAITRSEMKKIDDSLSDLKLIRKYGYIDDLTDPAFQHIRAQQPDEWERIKNVKKST
jgi:tetratricopeptide (TPR) repeat protein